MRRFPFLASLLLLLQSAFSLPAQTSFYVASSGSDTNPGTESAPFRSIEGARDFLRSMPRENTDVTVWIQPGEYVLPATIEFDERDGGWGTGTVTYRSRPGADVLLSGGTRITGWNPAEGSKGTLLHSPSRGRSVDCHGDRSSVGSAYENPRERPQPSG